MGFAPVNYSAMFESINNLNERKDIVNALSISLNHFTGYTRCYISHLCDLSVERNGKTIWFVDDLEAFFGIPLLNTMPFFRPEFFIGGWDHNAFNDGDHLRHYVTTCGLKKILLILAVLYQNKSCLFL